jgi:hypothetical protein
MDRGPFVTREDALHAAGRTLGLALSDCDSILLRRLVRIGISYADGGRDEELARLDGLPDGVRYATQAGYAVAALMSYWGSNFGLTDQDVTVFARGAADGALRRLDPYDTAVADAEQYGYTDAQGNPENPARSSR